MPCTCAYEPDQYRTGPYQGAAVRPNADDGGRGADKAAQWDADSACQACGKSTGRSGKGFASACRECKGGLERPSAECDRRRTRRVYIREKASGEFLPSHLEQERLTKIWHHFFRSRAGICRLGLTSLNALNIFGVNLTFNRDSLGNMFCGSTLVERVSS
jgi:hypothetical protein